MEWWHKYKSSMKLVVIDRKIRFKILFICINRLLFLEQFQVYRKLESAAGSCVYLCSHSCPMAFPDTDTLH